jgi:hypothetical protein
VSNDALPPSRFSRIKLAKRTLCSGASLLLVLAFTLIVTACNRLKSVQQDAVYVVAKQAYLRDRVAAVSNRVALVTNGQKLTVLEHNRRFVRVKTEKNEIGWLEDRAVIGPDVYQQFEDLSRKHAKDPVIATGVLRDDIYLHLKPGRDTDRYYLLPENEKLQLLVRASVAKPQQQAWAGLPKPIATPSRDVKANVPLAKKAGSTSSTTASAAPPLSPPVMEDWWLVRDSKGDVGWLLAHRLDVDVPDEISGYAEGQKIVGAYVLQTLDDPEASTPDKKVREYVTVLNAYKDGLSYDFDQVRVFTWNMKKHRYETAYRLRNIEGYLPVTVSQQNYGQAGTLPTFSFNQSVDGVVTADPETGAAKPVRTELQSFRLEGVIVRRVAGGGQFMVQPHPASEREKETAKKEKGKRHK